MITLKDIIHLLKDDFILELTHSDSPLWAKLGMKPKMYTSELPQELIDAFNQNGIQAVLNFYNQDN